MPHPVPGVRYESAHAPPRAAVRRRRLVPAHARAERTGRLPHGSARARGADDEHHAPGPAARPGGARDRPGHVPDRHGHPDAFISGDEKPDVEGTRYRAIQPEQSLTETNPANAANARLSKALPFDEVDLVPQRLADRIIWQSVFAKRSRVSTPGPNASPLERRRATKAMRVYDRGASVRSALKGRAGADSGEPDETREETTARLFALDRGPSIEDAEEKLEELEGEE